MNHLVLWLQTKRYKRIVPAQRPSSEKSLKELSKIMNNTGTNLLSNNSSRIDYNIFLKCFVHELNTPIQTIDLGLQCLEIEYPDYTSKETFQDIKISLEFIKEVIQNFSIAQSQQIKLNEFEPYSIRTLLANTIAVLPNDELFHNVKLETYIQSDIVDMNYMDESHLKQVLLNLLKNAIKYQTKHRENHICISINNDLNVDASSKPDTSQSILIEITDNNDHLLPHIKDHLFETFNTTSGSGLGLYISKTIIELHGGHIYHEHVYPLGNRFIVSLTLNICSDDRLHTIDEVHHECTTPEVKTRPDSGDKTIKNL